MASPPPPTVYLKLPSNCYRGRYNNWDYSNCSWADSSSAIFLWVFLGVFFLLTFSCLFYPYDYYTYQRPHRASSKHRSKLHSVNEHSDDLEDGA